MKSCAAKIAFRKKGARFWACVRCFTAIRGESGLPWVRLPPIVLIVTSSFFVWDITVTGTDKIPAKTITDALERHGVKLGAYIPSLDTEKIEQAMVLEVDGLSWITLNLRGTVASVEVRERSEDSAGGRHAGALQSHCGV